MCAAAPAQVTQPPMPLNPYPKLMSMIRWASGVQVARGSGTTRRLRPLGFEAEDLRVARLCWGELAQHEDTPQNRL